ncbi:MAG: gliding motility-associated C-terminal domain-containing protein [Bacteroidetes bacterium]|nr:MAG: gliding motility-associated C-terminal domain-containing protein [Bacteroidota bacterium]
MRYIFATFICLTTFSLSAQRFVQEFRTDRNDAAAAVQQVDNNEYLMAGYRFGLSTSDTGGLNLTKMSDLGRLRWSRDYDFDFPVVSPDLAYWRDQNGYLLSTMSAVDSVRDKIVARFSSAGSLVWARSLGAGSPVQFENTGRTKVLPVSDSTLVVAAGAGTFASDTSANNLLLAKLSEDGDLIWSRDYCFSCLGNYNALLGDMLHTSDGGFLISGSLYFADDGIKQEAMLLKADSSGQLSWVKSFAVDTIDFLLPRLTAWSLAEPKPGQYVLTGTYEDMFAGTTSGFFFIADSLGTLQYSTRWNVANGDFDISTFDLVVRDTNSVVLAGSTVENAAPDVAREFNFLAAVATDSFQVIWAKNYFNEIAGSMLTPYHALIQAGDMGYAYFITTDTIMVNTNPVLVKTDPDGVTGCEEDLMLFQDSISLKFTDWLIPVLDLAGSDTLELKDQQAFSDIMPTMEGLELTGGGGLECEPLMVLLDATVQEAESYLWSTGENTPMITATMQGMYTVEVSSDGLCFYLPDTTVVNVLPPPTGTVSADPDSLCAESQVLLFANGTPVYEFSWSTGENTPQITVSQTGTYTVTLTNPCGSTSLSIEVPRVGCICDLVFPNAFTPNNDATNDRFQPAFPCGNITDFELYVYNRWGEQVFQTNSQSDGWDGENNGQPAPSDVYAWYATFTTPEGEKMTMKGDVTLLR